MITPLCEIAFKYGTDKCPKLGHSYTPFYWELLKDKRNKFKKILELGIGCKERMPWTPPPQYQKGASLFMWRDFFPYAQIYGVDNDSRTIFHSERITTFLFDTREKVNLYELIKKIGSNIDLVIDDGAHNGRAQIQAARDLLPILNKDCIYIIEDTKNTYAICDKLSKDYDAKVIEFRNKLQEDDNLIIVRWK